MQLAVLAGGLAWLYWAVATSDISGTRTRRCDPGSCVGEVLGAVLVPFASKMAVALVAGMTVGVFLSLVIRRVRTA